MEKLKNFFKHFFDSNAVFMVMIVMYPLLFFMSINSAIYLPEQYLIAMLCLLFIALITSATIEFFFLILPKKSYFPFIKRALYLLIAFVIVYDPLRRVTSLFRAVILPISDEIFTVIAVTLLLLALLFDKKRVVNRLVVFLSLACLFLYAGAMFRGYSVWKQFWGASIDTLQEVEELKFASRPNVYYFYLESYHGREAMMELFNYDNAEFYGHLLKNKFHVYDNVYSNYQYTFAALLSTFQMKHHYNLFKRELFDATLFIRKNLAGNKFNLLLTAFRNNGYEINYFLQDDSFFQRAYGARFYNVKFDPLAALNPLVMWRLNNSWSAVNHETYISDMLAMIKEAHESSAPQFFFIGIGAGGGGNVNHVTHLFDGLPEEIRKNTTIADFSEAPWKFTDYFTELYAESVKEQNVLFGKLLDQIISDDPDAVIVLLGDHGTARYVGMGGKGMDNMLYYMSEAGITNRDFANSVFNVLLAVRIPPDLILPDINDAISSVNVFRYVLSSLSGTTHLIENKEEDVSLTVNNIISVRNGKPLEYPEPVNDIREYRRQKLGI